MWSRIVRPRKSRRPQCATIAFVCAKRKTFETSSLIVPSLFVRRLSLATTALFLPINATQIDMAASLCRWRGIEPLARAWHAHRPRGIDARRRIEPFVFVLLPEDHRHATVNRPHERIRRRRQDRVRLERVVSAVPVVVQSGERDQVAVGARDPILLLFLLALDRLPLEKRSRGHETTLALERTAKHRPCVGVLRARV